MDALRQGDEIDVTYRHRGQPPVVVDRIVVKRESAGRGGGHFREMCLLLRRCPGGSKVTRRAFQAIGEPPKFFWPWQIL